MEQRKGIYLLPSSQHHPRGTILGNPCNFAVCGRWGPPFCSFTLPPKCARNALAASAERPGGERPERTGGTSDSVTTNTGTLESRKSEGRQRAQGPSLHQAYFAFSLFRFFAPPQGSKPGLGPDPPSPPWPTWQISFLLGAHFQRRGPGQPMLALPR